MKNSKDRGKPSASFVAGSIALLFLIIGYQSALFIRKASVARIVANHDHPDTMYVYDTAGSVDIAGFAGRPSEPGRVNPRFAAAEYGLSPAASPAAGNSKSRYVRKEYNHSPEAVAIRRANTPRRYESFRFDPNTASVDDLMRLGFSQKQAQSIDNYRRKGGRFRRKADFAKSYVVEDSVYRRLERYIDIPKLDINKADSAAFETLPGIGKFFASKMVSYRSDLGGYSYPEQLMDIWHFDQEKFDGLKDLIFVGPAAPYPLWTFPEQELARHPYIGKRAAHGIILFRENTPPADWTVENLVKNGILDREKGEKLARCRIATLDNPA